MNPDKHRNETPGIPKMDQRLPPPVPKPLLTPLFTFDDEREPATLHYFLSNAGNTRENIFPAIPMWYSEEVEGKRAVYVHGLPVAFQRPVFLSIFKNYRIRADPSKNPLNCSEIYGEKKLN
jgi:hypothetical protein